MAIQIGGSVENPTSYRGQEHRKMFSVKLNSSWLKINWSQLKIFSSELNCIEEKNRGTFSIQLKILIHQLTVYLSTEWTSLGVRFILQNYFQTIPQCLSLLTLFKTCVTVLQNVNDTYFTPTNACFFLVERKIWPGE